MPYSLPPCFLWTATANTRHPPSWKIFPYPSPPDHPAISSRTSSLSTRERTSSDAILLGRMVGSRVARPPGITTLRGLPWLSTRPGISTSSGLSFGPPMSAICLGSSNSSASFSACSGVMSGSENLSSSACFLPWNNASTMAGSDSSATMRSMRDE